MTPLDPDPGTRRREIWKMSSSQISLATEEFINPATLRRCRLLGQQDRCHLWHFYPAWATPSMDIILTGSLIKWEMCSKLLKKTTKNQIVECKVWILMIYRNSFSYSQSFKSDILWLLSRHIHKLYCFWNFEQNMRNKWEMFLILQEQTYFKNCVPFETIVYCNLNNHLTSSC